VVTTRQEILTFGDNSEGQLGLNIDNKSSVDRPSIIVTTGAEIRENIAQVSCGYRHTLVLTENGRVYGFGTNKRYELGLGHHTQQTRFNSAVRIAALDTYDIIKIAAGGFSAALTHQNEVLMWG
jgi:alpha-tubulin suppressor-like RCC1 family protein